MTAAAPPPSGPPPARCPACGGSWTEGRIAVPIVGSLRFVYRLGTTEVTTEVAADLCVSCGNVRLRARDPKLIDRARRAGEIPARRRSAGRREG